MLVLKGPRTLVAAPDGRLSLNPTGRCPALASGGVPATSSGPGLISGFLAQGLSAWDGARPGGLPSAASAPRIVPSRPNTAPGD